MYSNNPMLNQQMAMLDQKYAQEKANIMQNFYAQNQSQNNYQQNIQTQSQPQPTSSQTQNVSWIPVNGIPGAKEHQVPANATHWLMDSTEDAFYVKSSDEFGVIKSFKGYRFSEIPPQELSGVPESVDMSQYVSRKDFDELKELITQLTTTQKKQSTKVKEGVDNG